MESIAHGQLMVAIVVAVIGFTGLWFTMPNLLRYLGDLRKEKRHAKIRDAFVQQPLMQHLGDLMLRTQLSEKQLRKGLRELTATGEVHPATDQHGLEVWSKYSRR